MLKHKVLAAFRWSGVEAFMQNSLAFFVSIFLARLLLPEDFGIIAILAVFMSVSSLFIDGGFGQALIQRKCVTSIDESSVFWFNIVVSLIAVTSIWALAPWISEYFELPILKPLAYLMSVNLFLSALGSVPKTMLTKRLEFRSMLNISVMASFLSGIVAVLLAWMGYGVWSLAWQTIVATSITSIMFWRRYPISLSVGFKFSVLGKLSRFGGYMMASSLLNSLHSGLQATLISKLFSVTELGFYLRAQGTLALPVGMTSGVVERVALPVFSEAASDPLRLTRAVRQLLAGLMFINVPMTLGLAATAEQITLMIFGEKWLPAVPYLQVLCFAGVLWPLHVVNLKALLSQGRSNLYFRLEFVKRVMGIVVIVAASLHSMMAIVWGQVAVGVISFILNSHYSARFLNYSTGHQLKDVIPIGAVSAGMAMLVWVVGRAINFGPAVELAILVPLGALTYVSICYWLKISGFTEILDALGVPQQARVGRLQKSVLR